MTKRTNFMQASTLEDDERAALSELLRYLIAQGHYDSEEEGEQDAEERVLFFSGLGLYRKDPQLINASKTRKKVHALIYAHELHDVIMSNAGYLPDVSPPESSLAERGAPIEKTIDDRRNVTGKLLDLVEQHIDSEDEYSAVDKLKAIGLEHDKACLLVEIVMLKKRNFFSRTSRIKRFFGKGEKDAKGIFELLCRSLLSSGDYKSVDEIHKKIAECEKTYEELEVKNGYRDDLYYYSTVIKRKIIILVNLHLNDLDASPQNEVVNFIGRENLLRSATQRTRHLRQMLDELMKGKKAS